MEMKIKLQFVFIFGLLSLVKGQIIDTSQFSQQDGFSSLISSSLPSEAYSEGVCIEPQVANNVDPAWIGSQKTFYVPIASQFAYQRYAETFLSRTPSSESELQSMCLTTEFISKGNGVNITSLAYDEREFKQRCEVSGPAKLTCTALGSSPGVNPTKTHKTDGYIVSIDNRSFMLLVRCVDGFFRDYTLLTTRPSISLSMYNNVLNITRNLGFDERRLQLASYDNCPRSTDVNVSNLRQFDNIRGRIFSEPTSSFISGLTAPFARNNLNPQSTPRANSVNIPNRAQQRFPQSFNDPNNPFGFPTPFFP